MPARLWLPILGFALCVPGAPAGAQESDEPQLRSDLDASTFLAWRDYLLPTAEESAWQEIPWLPSFAAGVLEADREGRPLLLWAMNGHPLGCT